MYLLTMELLTFIQFSYIAFNFLNTVINVVKRCQSDVTLYFSPWWYLIDTAISCLASKNSYVNKNIV